jgi:hypothetical protein
MGLSGAGSKGSSVIADAHSLHFQSPLIIGLGAKSPCGLSLNFLKTIF